MAVADDWGGVPVDNSPKADDWGGVPVDAPKLPDMEGVKQTAIKNLSVPMGDDGVRQEQFGAKLDRAAGMPISGVIGTADGNIELSQEMRGHLVNAYKNGSATDAGDFFQSAVPALATAASPQIADKFSPKQMLQNVIRGIAPMVNQAAKSGEAIQEGLHEGAQFQPFGENGTGTVQGLANVPFQLAAAIPGIATHLAQNAGEQVGYKGGGADAEAALMAAGMLGLPHPELQETVGAKIGKPPEAVTHNDIAQAIRMGFGDKGIPKAQEFKDTAAVLVGHEAEAQGESVLHTVYEKTGVPPDKILADAQVDPTIAEDIKAGKTPDAYTRQAPPIDLAPSGSSVPREVKIGGTTLNYLVDDKGVNLENVTTAPELRSQGSMNAALEKLIKAADEKELPIRLKVDPQESSVDAERLEQGYRKLGFRRVSGWEDTDVVHMERPAPTTQAEVIRESADTHEASVKDITPEKAPEVSKTIEDAVNRVINSNNEVRDALSRTIPEIVDNIKRTGEEARPEPSADVAVQEPAKISKSRNKSKGDAATRAAPAEQPTAESAGTTTTPDAAATRSELTPEHQELEDKLGVPEMLNASQLGKLDKKISSIFANKAPEGLPNAADLTDPQFQALEDYAKRIEAARDTVETKPIGQQVKSFVADEAGAFSVPQAAKDYMNGIKDDVLSFATPMETGSPRAAAAAKDFANKQRWAQWNGARIVNLLTEQFSPEELKGMWEAMDEASVHAQRLESDGMSREDAMAQTERDSVGHFALPDNQREIVKALSDWAQQTWDQAKKLDMVRGEGLPFWTPRMAVAIGEDGAWRAPSNGGKPSVDVGRNLTTTSGNLKQRKYLTAEETEAAMKKAFGGEEGEGAKLIRDIRSMPLALTRLEQAVGGRSLVEEIKALGKETGAETVGNSAREGYFTMDHPALQTYKPRLQLNEEGKWEVQKDAEGNDIFDKVPLYVSKEFEGPLNAVLSHDSSATYKALMEAKGKAMSLIMYSPLIHNAVEYGRALPAVPGKVFTTKIYFEGNRIKNDPVQMKEAIDAGLVPIGNRFFNQDISSIIEQPNLTPGRSWTAKLLGGLTGEVNAKAGEAVKAAIDKAGDFWHNTLLWDRVADLQMGLYSNLRDKYISQGMEPQAAQSVAAHFANRFAGALPKESMGDMATKLANVTMFSRTFTIGNLGVMKDMFKGLPSDVMAQLSRDLGDPAAKAASKVAQRKAIAAFALDIGLMYAGNSILQDTLDHMKRDKSWSQIGQGYVDRFNKLVNNHSEHPWELLNLPADMDAMSSTSTNEPGKENRILYDKDPTTGTAHYVRLPTGKIGEEFLKILTSPLQYGRDKLSTIAKPLSDIYHNEDAFGHPVYDKTAHGVTGSAENIGKVVTHLMEAQIPLDSIKSAYNLLTGGSKDKSLDYMKTIGPLGGLTFSKGYPGGPEAGIIAATSRRHEAEVSSTLPQVKEAIEADDETKARDFMDKLGMTPKEQRAVINHYRNPQSKVNSRSLHRFEQIATPEEKELMDRQQ